MVEAVEKQARALELTKEGKTYEQIAAILGYANRAGAYKAVSTALKNTVQEPADELRTLHSIRLRAMWDAIWWAVQKGDPQAIDRALKIMEREAKLMGLDAPASLDLKHEGSVTTYVVDIGSSGANSDASITPAE